MSTDSVQVCKPNFSGPGRVRRLRFGYAVAAVAVAMLVGFALAHSPWYVRLSVFVPAAMAAVSLLQVSRNTCVAHAAKGTFEHDDFSTTKQNDEDAAASRRVAATIYRDGLLVGVGAACVAVASALAFVA